MDRWKYMVKERQRCSQREGDGQWEVDAGQ